MNYTIISHNPTTRTPPLWSDPKSPLVPQQDQSGEVDKQLHITHAGSDICRTALVECAGVALMSNAPETDIKLKGLRIAMRGGKAAKKEKAEKKAKAA